MKVGTPVFVEGPHGIMTGAARTKARVLLVAGGIGITPLRALLEELPASRGNLTLVYRASGPDEVVFKREIDELASLRGATVHYLVGRAVRARCRPIRSIRGPCDGSCPTSTTVTSTSAARPE
jgi:predicted ferric reductase